MVVEYTYDAWGKVLSTTGSMAGTLGTIQPFRYRGYVYDVETGLYYLRSRYYSPKSNRFINADSVLEGISLFSYCENKPLLRLDSNGFDSTLYVSDYDVALRKNSSVSSDCLIRVSYCTDVTLLETIENKDGQWCKVQCGPYKGYIKKEYLSDAMPEDYAFVKEAGYRYGSYTYPTEAKKYSSINNLQEDLNTFFRTYQDRNPDEALNNLTQWACYPLKIDGEFGPVTAVAVLEVKQRLKIYPATDIADQKFKVALYKYLYE